MRKSLRLAMTALTVSAFPVFAQEATPPVEPAPTEQTPAITTEQPAANVTVIEPTGGATEGLSGAAMRLREIAQQLQQATAENAEQVRQDAAQALDEMQQALQGSGAAQDQMVGVQQQIDDARGQLDADPQQAGQTLLVLADSVEQMGTAQQQPEIPAEADRIIGKALMTSAGEEAGEVADVLVTSDGQVEAIIVERGGVLGMGGSSAVVAWDQIEIQGDQISVNMTAEEMDALPEYTVE